MEKQKVMIVETTKIKLAGEFDMVCEYIISIVNDSETVMALDSFGEQDDAIAVIDTQQKLHWLTVTCYFCSNADEDSDGYTTYHNTETLLKIIVSDRVGDVPVMLTIIDSNDKDGRKLTEHYRGFAKEIIDELRKFELVADDKKHAEMLSSLHHAVDEKRVEPVPPLHRAVLDSINTLHSKQAKMTLTSIAIDLVTRGFYNKATGNEYSASHISEIITKLEKAGYDVSKYRDNSNKRISS